ncbi:hypothetical protein Pint_15114 [Pistacia integerrima]|uniref:Uncharacterized protein n=1 Tax=Pistacia integerrima TaxID=434235 RepID=A0ACC0ZEA8_9ROSI|nr:hypothetical protein Pint_15114 [Pistacia integerrima]
MVIKQPFNLNILCKFRSKDSLVLCQATELKRTTTFDDSSSNVLRHMLTLFFALFCHKCHYVGNPLLIVPNSQNHNHIHCPSHHSEKAMAAAINFSEQALPRSVGFKGREGINLISLPPEGSCMLKQQKMKLQQHGMSMTMRRQAGSKSSITVVSSTRLDDYESSPFSAFSASDMIAELYKCINEKNLQELDAYISNDCRFEECSFPKPFKGKKEVVQFFEQLMASMGQNVKFNVEHICEDDDFTAGVNWHLEWKGAYIPFTRGCSFYECSKEGDRLLIK